MFDELFRQLGEYIEQLRRLANPPRSNWRRWFWIALAIIELAGSVAAYYFGGWKGAAFATAVAIATFGGRYFVTRMRNWWRRTPVAVPPPPVAQKHTFGPINPSVWMGALLCFIGAVLLFLLTGFVLSRFGIDLFWTRLFLFHSLAGLYFYTSLNSEVKYGFRGMTLVFGARFPFLCTREGLPEGLNFVPKAIVIVPVDIRERRVMFMNNVEQYTKDKVLSKARGFLQFFPKDVFEYKGIEGAEDSLSGLALQAGRTVIKQYTAKELVEKGKDELSLETEQELRRLVTEDGRYPEAFHWGLQVNHVVFEEIRIREDVEAAWSETPRQEALGDAQRIETQRRAEQVEILTKQGVKPDSALAAVLMDAGNEGARVNSTTIHGLEDVGHGFESMGKGLEALAERFLTRDNP